MHRHRMWQVADMTRIFVGWGCDDDRKARFCREPAQDWAEKTPVYIASVIVIVADGTVIRVVITQVDLCFAGPGPEATCFLELGRGV